MSSEVSFRQAIEAIITKYAEIERENTQLRFRLINAERTIERLVLKQNRSFWPFSPEETAEMLKHSNPPVDHHHV